MSWVTSQCRFNKIDDKQIIAIITPNRKAPGSGTIQLPNQSLPITVNNWSDWREWRVSVNYLEELTGYDFLANLPNEIEEVIEDDNL